MKSCLIFLILFPTIVQVMAQETSTRHYLPIGVGLSFHQSKDAFFSPLRYRGAVPKFLLGYQGVSADERADIQMSYQMGDISNGAKFPGSLGLDQTTYRQNHVFRIPSDQSFNYFLGFSLKVNFSSRESSRNSTFDGEVTLGLTGSISYMRDPGDRWDYEASASLPLIGWGIRPRFAATNYILPKASNLKGPSQHVLFFPKYFDLDTRFRANWYMRNGNALQMDYRWWFFDMRYLHRMRLMENSLSVALLSRLR